MSFEPGKKVVSASPICPVAAHMQRDEDAHDIIDLIMPSVICQESLSLVCMCNCGAGAALLPFSHYMNGPHPFVYIVNECEQAVCGRVWDSAGKIMGS